MTIDITTRLATTFSIGLLSLAMAACGSDRNADGPDAVAGDGTEAAEEATSFIGRQAAKGIARAQRELETQNIRIGGKHRIEINGMSFGTEQTDDERPRAEITPEGSLLIDGSEVATTPAQRALLLEHRRHIVDIAKAGMAIGAKGADIAGTALTGVGQAMFGGDEGRKAYEARIEAEAERIRQEALGICTLLPGLYDSQQSLTTALPEFAPYATMTPEDIEDCGKDEHGDAATAATGHTDRT